MVAPAVAAVGSALATKVATDPRVQKFVIGKAKGIGKALAKKGVGKAYSFVKGKVGGFLAANDKAKQRRFHQKLQRHMKPRLMPRR